jgi:hypothetical protein
MIENIDKVLDRGDRLELLVDKTANMQGNTFRFRKQARRFRSTVWWRNVKLTYVLELNPLCIQNCFEGNIAKAWLVYASISFGCWLVYWYGTHYIMNLSKGS